MCGWYDWHPATVGNQSVGNQHLCCGQLRDTALSQVSVLGEVEPHTEKT